MNIRRLESLNPLIALQLILRHCSKTHHSLCFTIHHLLLPLSSSDSSIHLQWVPSHVGVMSNTVADRAAAEAQSHPFPIHLPTDSLTNLQTACKLHRDLTNALQYTSLGRIRQDTTPLVDLLPQPCPWHCHHQTPNWTQPPKLPSTQAGHDRGPPLSLVSYTTWHPRTPNALSSSPLPPHGTPPLTAVSPPLQTRNGRMPGALPEYMSTGWPAGYPGQTLVQQVPGLFSVILYKWSGKSGLYWIWISVCDHKWDLVVTGNFSFLAKKKTSVIWLWEKMNNLSWCHYVRYTVVYSFTHPVSQSLRSLPFPTQRYSVSLLLTPANVPTGYESQRYPRSNRLNLDSGTTTHWRVAVCDGYPGILDWPGLVPVPAITRNPVLCPSLPQTNNN